MHDQVGAAELERNLQAGAARPRQLAVGALRHQSQHRRPLTGVDPGEQRDALGAHRQTQRHVLDERPRDPPAVFRADGSAHLEIGVWGVRPLSSRTGGGDQRFCFGRVLSGHGLPLPTSDTGQTFSGV
jgi:hypothetical protein